MKFSKFSYLFLWLFFSGLLLSGMIASAFLGYWHEIPQLDRTYISFLIIVVFIIGWIYSLADIIWLTRLVPGGGVTDLADFENSVVARDERTHFFTRILPALGFMGTLVGMLMIFSSLSPLIAAERELSGLRSHILGAVGGLSTAALTTVIGLGAYIFLELFHIIFRSACAKISTRTGDGKDENDEA